MTLGSGLMREQAEQAFANLTLVNFNYDRTVEQYLYWALQQYGRVSAEVAANAVASLDQIRPYGSIGNLRWQENPGPPFGGSEGGDNLFSVAKTIRTYTEQQYAGTEQKIGQALESARLVVPQNMKLLKPPIGKTYQMHTVIATVKDVSAEDRFAVGEQLRIAFRGGANFGRQLLLDSTCHSVLTGQKLSIVTAAQLTSGAPVCAKKTCANVQAIFCRRRDQPRRPPPAKISDKERSVSKKRADREKASTLVKLVGD